MYACARVTCIAPAHFRAAKPLSSLEPRNSAQKNGTTMSFLDLLLAEAISAGLARQAAEREPPPENFFVLPGDPRAWRMFQAASKKETMVVAIEITNNMAPNCRAVQPLFIELARKFSNVPFLRVEIGLGRTYDEVRRIRF